MRVFSNLLILLALLTLGACASTAGRMEVRAFGDPSALAGNQSIDVILLAGERTPEQQAFKSLIEQAFRDEGYTVVPRGSGAIHAVAHAGVFLQSDTPPRDRWSALITVMNLGYTGRPLFEGKAVAAGRCGSLTEVAPALVHAIFETFPEGGLREVTVADDPTRCSSGPDPTAP